MKFIPILFSTPMVQAILEGRKTMTRRIIKPQPIVDEDSGFVFDGKHQTMYKNDIGHPDWKIDFIKDHCRYGQDGDVLWVREKHRVLIDCKTQEFNSFDYYADMPDEFHKQYKHKWKPGIHMPKAACRIFLQVKNIKVERVQDISEADAIVEGVEFDFSEGVQYKNYNPGCDTFEYSDPRDSFKSLWQSINGAKSWNANPWVWVVSFERIDKPENFI